MKKLLIAIVILSVVEGWTNKVAAQEPGIKWTTGLTWNQIKQKAKAEKKYIFIDAYTTWCGPCKKMDKDVYINDTVGIYMNEKFISVKVQMDVTEKDNQSIKDWYNDATAIKTEYMIEAYPSLIFLSPDGKILQKEEGYRPVQQLVTVAKEALIPGKVYDDPYKEYKALVNEYKLGIKHFDKMPYIIRNAMKLNDTALVRQLFKEHLDYVSQLNEAERYTKEHINLWGSFILKLDSKALQFFLRDGNKIDGVMNQKGHSSQIVDMAIQSRIVDSFFKMQKGETAIITGAKIPNSKIMFMQLPISIDGKIDPDFVEADWKELERMIFKRFNKDFVKRNVLTARMRWYKQHQNMAKASEMYFTQLDKYPPASFGFEIVFPLNQFAWQTFLYVTDKKILKKAAGWIEKAMQHKSDYDAMLDTYANLLYKIGRVNEAIMWEEKAINVTNPVNERQLKAFKEVVELMKRGEPTYLDQGAIWNN